MALLTDELTFFFKQGSTKDRVFAVYIYFTKHSDEEVCQKAITGLGKCIFTRKRRGGEWSLFLAGLVRVLEIVKSPGILFWHFPGLEGVEN